MFTGGGSSNASYTVKQQQARSLIALEGDTDRNRFVVSSLDLRGDNEVTVLEFNEDMNELMPTAAFAHANEVWHCVSCPAPENAELIATTFSTGSECAPRCGEWRGVCGLAKRRGTRAPASGLVQVRACLCVSTSGCMERRPPDQIITLTKRRLARYARRGRRRRQRPHGASAGRARRSAGRWDPHHAHSLGVYNELILTSTRAP